MSLTDLPPSELVGKWIQFEDNQKIAFSSLADLGSAASTGLVEVIDVYDENYLIAYALMADDDECV